MFTKSTTTWCSVLCLCPSTGINALVTTSANTWGLFILVLLLGYGLIDVPRSLWYFGRLDYKLQKAYFQVAKLRNESEETKEALEDVFKVSCTSPVKKTKRNREKIPLGAKVCQKLCLWNICWCHMKGLGRTADLLVGLWLALIYPIIIFFFYSGGKKGCSGIKFLAFSLKLIAFDLAEIYWQEVVQTWCVGAVNKHRTSVVIGGGKWTAREAYVQYWMPDWWGIWWGMNFKCFNIAQLTGTQCSLMGSSYSRRVCLDCPNMAVFFFVSWNLQISHWKSKIWCGIRDMKFIKKL